jgi:RsiW-degrading membrane proteinase PrsW (M82 family)
MIGNATPDFKSRIKIYAAKLVDYSWDASLVITFLFGAIVLVMLVFALAINYKLISPPPLLCHYMIGTVHIEEFCK